MPGKRVAMEQAAERHQEGVSGHPLVGATLHFAFSAPVGVAFVLVLFAIRQSGLFPLLGVYAGYAAASIAGGAMLYLVMWYLVLPWANSQFKDLALKGPFFVAHLVFGMAFGLAAFPMLRRTHTGAGGLTETLHIQD
jgi:hypothetical protein